MKITGLFFISFLVFFVSINGLANAGKLFKVGDEFGWQEPGGNTNTTNAVYTKWAENNRFRVGDSLLFVYKNDSVVQVEKFGYFHCSSTKPIVAFNNGRSIFNFDKSGPFYFISGAPNHCKRGQRLIAEVMGEHHPRSPPSIANPPDQSNNYNAPSPQPSSGTLISARIGSVSVFVAATILVNLVWSF
ncbi:early nodulin-like protein 21 [Mercurialis annua]|uniref:early nodulin-like protein 21 n=1 Tax=Mercurialis annua TaxID=3986 RepID=UPI002160CC52|nr:early nodulin-like protein 21 [Mercurialis annua]